MRVRPRDRYALLTFGDGTTRKDELYDGSTYLSQSSRILWVPTEATKVVVHDADGAARTIVEPKGTSGTP